MIYVSHLFSDGDMKAVPNHEKLGLESIEFSIGYCLDKLEESIASYKERMKNMGYGTLSVHGPFLDLNPASNDVLIRRATRERFEQSYYAAQILGADKIIYHSCFLPRVNFLEGWTDLAVPFWTDFLKDKDDSIKIHMENVFDPICDNLRECAARIDHPAFSLCLDLGHANHASLIPLAEWIEELAPYIGHIHIHDNDGITDGHLAAGRGSIPWGEVFDALHQYCPQVDYTIENTSLEAVSETLDKLKTQGLAV